MGRLRRLLIFPVILSPYQYGYGGSPEPDYSSVFIIPILLFLGVIACLVWEWLNDRGKRARYNDNKEPDAWNNSMDFTIKPKLSNNKEEEQDWMKWTNEQDKDHTISGTDIVLILLLLAVLAFLAIIGYAMLSGMQGLGAGA